MTILKTKFIENIRNGVLSPNLQNFLYGKIFYRKEAIFIEN